MTEKLHQQTLTVEHDRKTNENDPNNKKKTLRRLTWMSEFDQNNKNEIKSVRRRTWMSEYDRNNKNEIKSVRW